jgi:hypothetical protein
MDDLIMKNLSAILAVDVSYEDDKPVKLNSINWKKKGKTAFERIENENFLPLTRGDLSKSCLKGDTIIFVSDDDEFRMTFKSKRKWFSYSQVFKNILDFERENRNRKDTDSYCDDLHIFFEGIKLTEEPNTFIIYWGS